MATIDDYCEARSSDDSDAGSLEDFIAGSDSEEEEAGSSGGFEGAPPCSSEGEPEVDVANIIATRQAGSSLRRSTRTSKAPVRYVDDDYIRLMTEDANAEDAVSSEAGSDEYREEDEEDEEYDVLSESETSSDAYSSDEDSSELRVVPKKRRLNSSE